MATVTTATGQTIDIGETGALFGAPPPYFRGDRAKADQFLLIFKGWKAANNTKRAMVNPYTCIAVALTFIEGEDVQDWKEHEHKLLEERVLNGHARTEEYLWQEFEKAFKAVFRDMGKMLNAQTKLDTLRQDKEGVERYMVTFNCLLKQAGFDEDDKGSVNLYRKGLLPGLHKACIQHKPMPMSMKEWQEVANKEQLIFHKIQHIQTQQGTGQYTPTPKPKFQTPLTHFWKALGPNAMNIDLTTTEDTPNASTRICYNCQKPGHIKANCHSPRAPCVNIAQTQEATICKTCGYCRKPGHDAKECYSLKREKAWLMQSPSTTNSKAQARVMETNSDAGTEQILLTKDNFKDMLLSLPDEEHMTVVEEMLSQDFSGETN
jgi:hypothetical protein